MNLKHQKELISRALKVSPKRIKIGNDLESKKAVKDIVSREDVQDLIDSKFVKKLPKKGISKTRAKHIRAQKAKGRRAGQGKRKGTANARFKKKDKWMIKIRALRLHLKKLKTDSELTPKVTRELYKKAKGNFFRNKKHMALYISQNELKETKEVKK